MRASIPPILLQCDVTAVGATMCRHSIVAHLLDISTGERYIYACVMLHMLVMQRAAALLVVWYDINCKFSAYFMRWLTSQPVLMAALMGVRLLFPLPCFHSYAHRCEVYRTVVRCTAGGVRGAA